jgi:hypothetical protein
MKVSKLKVEGVISFEAMPSMEKRLGKKKIWQLKINFFNFVEKQMKTLSFLSTNGNPERRITNFIFQLAESLGYKIPHGAGLK